LLLGWLNRLKVISTVVLLLIAISSGADFPFVGPGVRWAETQEVVCRLCVLLSARVWSKESASAMSLQYATLIPSRQEKNLSAQGTAELCRTPQSGPPPKDEKVRSVTKCRYANRKLCPEFPVGHLQTFIALAFSLVHCILNNSS
jgi:hypothetical protein